MTATEIAAKVYANSNHSKLEYNINEDGSVEFLINDNCLVLGNEFNDEGEYYGYTYSTYWREPGEDRYSNYVTTDGATDNVGLYDFLTDWIAEHA